MSARGRRGAPVEPLIFGVDGEPLQWTAPPPAQQAPPPVHAFAVGAQAWFSSPVSGVRLRVIVRAALPRLRYAIEREDTGQALETAETQLDPRRGGL